MIIVKDRLSSAPSEWPCNRLEKNGPRCFANDTGTTSNQNYDSSWHRSGIGGLMAVEMGLAMQASPGKRLNAQVP